MAGRDWKLRQPRYGRRECRCDWSGLVTVPGMSDHDRRDLVAAAQLEAYRTRAVAAGLLLAAEREQDLIAAEAGLRAAVADAALLAPGAAIRGELGLDTATAPGT